MAKNIEPKLRKIGDYLKLDSTSSVVYHLKSLKSKVKYLEITTKTVQ